MHLTGEPRGCKFVVFEDAEIQLAGGPPGHTMLLEHQVQDPGESSQPKAAIIVL